MPQQPPKGQTPSQTVGPFFAYGLTPSAYGRPGIAGADLAGPDTPGERIVLTGAVLDAEGQPVPDAMLECWQADAQGRYVRSDQPPRAGGFTGFGRCPTDERGRYRFATVLPGLAPHPNGGLQAPHLNLLVFARGLLIHLHTRAYFADQHNERDPVLETVPGERRDTLIAQLVPSNAGKTYRLDIKLSGEGETVFFEF